MKRRTARPGLSWLPSLMLPSLTFFALYAGYVGAAHLITYY